jgi:hypothetical protein
MARGSLNPITPWRLRALTIPPRSLVDWIRLAAWELWMGSLICALCWGGAAMLATSPDRIITAEDFAPCYAAAPAARPCEPVVYRTGVMNAAFSALSGLMMMLAAFWLIWELWDAVAPRPITDDFLRMLSDSFAGNWRDPRTWPWSRVGWAYGFSLIGAAMAASVAFAFWTLLTP